MVFFSQNDCAENGKEIKQFILNILKYISIVLLDLNVCMADSLRP